MAEDVQPVQLKPETLLAFETYIRDAEAAMELTLDGDAFLWSDGDPKRAKQVRQGKIVAEFWQGKGPVKVPSGLIHDWIGAAFLPGATVPRILARIQDYDNHKNIYRPEVIDSKLIARRGDDFQIYLRVLKKKIITVVLDTDHDVHYFRVDGAGALGLPLLHHAHRRGGRRGQAQRKGPAARCRLRFPVAHEYLLAI